MTRLYIAGPMTGLPDFNYPAFHAAAKVLRALGHEVLNPAENPAPACGTWAGYMRMALAQLVQCEGIVLLPGWADSKGALIERKLAQVLGMSVALYAGTPESRWAKVTEARYAAAIPVVCKYQSVDEHLESMVLCRTLLDSLENGKPANCGRCYLATRTAALTAPQADKPVARDGVKPMEVAE